MSLPGLEAEPASFTPEPRASTRGEPLGYTLFFAIFPQTEDAGRVAEAALDESRRHGRGKPTAAHRLHVTLPDLGHFHRTVPQDIVDAATAAAAAVNCRHFELKFDRAMSLGGDAFVLRCDADGDAAVGRLRRTLQTLLKHKALRPRPSNTPHMTIAYGLPGIAEHAIESIRWTATGFALILSHVGLNHHQQLGRWPLGVDAGRAWRAP